MVSWGGATMTEAEPAPEAVQPEAGEAVEAECREQPAGDLGQRDDEVHVVLVYAQVSSLVLQ